MARPENNPMENIINKKKKTAGIGGSPSRSSFGGSSMIVFSLALIIKEIVLIPLFLLN
ncbi:MAG: hypothetical protein ACXAB7_02950 [Candidatus Kariarchaeaceae archaeon]|jgi:hypothetical protein